MDIRTYQYNHSKHVGSIAETEHGTNGQGDFVVKGLDAGVGKLTFSGGHNSMEVPPNLQTQI